MTTNIKNKINRKARQRNKNKNLIKELDLKESIYNPMEKKLKENP